MAGYTTTYPTTYPAAAGGSTPTPPPASTRHLVRLTIGGTARLVNLRRAK